MAPVVSLYTFGSPRVGNEAFASWAGAALGRVRRVARELDIVPHVPPRELIGYAHLPQELWNRHNATDDWLVACDAENGEDPLCSDQEINTSTDEHTLYLGIRGGFC